MPEEYLVESHLVYLERPSLPQQERLFDIGMDTLSVAFNRGLGVRAPDWRDAEDALVSYAQPLCIAHEPLLGLFDAQPRRTAHRAAD
jgi:hypothetical protein